MKAPSEKHLEDWLFETPDALSMLGQESVIAVGRQIRLPSGIPDIIAIIDGRFTVVELKKGEIDGNSVIQLMRYVAEMKLVWSIATEFCPNVPPASPHFPTEDLLLHGLLVGERVSQQVCDLAQAAGISVATYDYDGHTYRINHQYYGSTTPKQCLEIAKGDIGVAMRSVFGHFFRKYYDPQYDISAAEYKWQAFVHSEGYDHE